MLCSRNHHSWISKLAFFTQYNSLEIHPGCCMYEWFLLSLVAVVSHGCTAICLNFHLLKDIWTDASFWLLWLKLLGTFMYTFLCECKFSFLWNKGPGVQLLGRIVVECLIL